MGKDISQQVEVEATIKKIYGSSIPVQILGRRKPILAVVQEMVLFHSLSMGRHTLEQDQISTELIHAIFGSIVHPIIPGCKKPLMEVREEEKPLPLNYSEMVMSEPAVPVMDPHGTKIFGGITQPAMYGIR